MPGPGSYGVTVPPYLTRDCRDAWVLAAGALDAGLVEVANGHATRAFELSGRARYQVAMAQGTEVLKCPLVPPGWAFQIRSGWLPILLVHPAAGPFLVTTFGPEFNRLMRRLREQGEGWARLDGPLAELLSSYFEVPDDVGDLPDDFTGSTSSWP